MRLPERQELEKTRSVFELRRAEGCESGAGENAKHFRLASMSTPGAKPHFFRDSLMTVRYTHVIQGIAHAAPCGPAA